MDAASQYALAYSLTTAAGVRAVLSLALVSIAMHFGVLHPPENFTWLASPLAMWILIGVGIVEVFADKIPVVDNVLHVAQTVVKPAAAAIIVGGSIHAQSNEMLIFLMVLGALNALGVHAGVAAVRGASTVTTAGIANPAISTAEDVGTIGGVIAAFFAPILMAIVALVLAIALVFVARRILARA
jgi:hypothetical protein